MEEVIINTEDDDSLGLKRTPGNILIEKFERRSIEFLSLFFGTADAVVIGGGIMGASMAHFLAKRGLGKVALLEKRALAAVSTGHSAAKVRTYYSNEMTVKPLRIGRRSYHSGHHPVAGDLLR